MTQEIHAHHTSASGFTLIELSIVLLVIGLIVGGVLVGQSLIRASEIRATVAQIEKYNTAVNTFRNKYNAIPGDMPQNVASAFGFSTRGANAGQGDGNGIIEGWNGTTNTGFAQGGETLSFWADLSVGNAAAPLNINLIDGSFSAYASPSVAAPAITSSNASSYFPLAKLGRGNFIYVYSTQGINRFGIAPMTTTATTGAAGTLTATMTVEQAYQIDKKVDDGFPATGNVLAIWDSGTLAENATPPSVNVSVSDSSSSCYNTSAGATPGAYSLSIQNGAEPNCSLSFRFQ